MMISFQKIWCVEDKELLWIPRERLKHQAADPVWNV